MELKNKTLVFLGSSVTYGSAAGGFSMCEYLRETTDADVVKWAVSGTTLANTDETSYVSRMLCEMESQEKCDHFVVQLSTNDAGRCLELGVISDSLDRADFDTKTTLGAIEFIISAAREKWNCPISFYTGTYFDNPHYQTMVDKLFEISRKWNIGVIDLWNDSEMRSVSDEDYAVFMNDPVHPTKIGYEQWWGPKFTEHLRKA